MSESPGGRTACLTLDLENDWYFDEPGYDHLTLEHLDEFVGLISELDVPLSVFVVGRTMERFPDAVDRLADRLDCEFHLHSYSHDVSKSYEFEEEVRVGIDAYEDHFGRRPSGYRAPQGNVTAEELATLDRLGFEFDSSVFPSYRPGVYNNVTAPLTPYRPAGAESLVEVPIAAAPGVRVPICLSYLKLLGRPYLRYLSHGPLPSPMVFNLHLQDLYRTASYERISRAKRFAFMRNIDRATAMLVEFVERLRERGYRFEHVSDVSRRVRRREGSSVRTDRGRTVPDGRRTGRR